MICFFFLLVPNKLFDCAIILMKCCIINTLSSNQWKFSSSTKKEEYQVKKIIVFSPFIWYQTSNIATIELSIDIRNIESEIVSWIVRERERNREKGERILKIHKSNQLAPLFAVDVSLLCILRFRYSNANIDHLHNMTHWIFVWVGSL